MAKTVLIVDDSLVMRKVIMRMLRECGFDGTAIEADGGPEALARFAGHAIDLILCDWNMPATNALQLVEAIRKLDPACTVPIIMITTQTNSAKVQQAILAGVQDYLIKPFTPEMLSSKLAGYFQNQPPGSGQQGG
jgi:two-component system chemotaxis response regulator CheY